MRNLWNLGIVSSSLLWIGLAAAQDATSPTDNNASLSNNISLAGKQYDVLVIRAGMVDQGLITFESSVANQVAADSNSNSGSNPNSTSAGNDPNFSGANPVATGNFGTVGNPNGATGNTTGNTSGSISSNQSGTTTSNTSGTSTTNTTGTANTGTSTTATTSDPPNYWTRDRVNGRVATQTNNSSSSDYWTTARTHGKGGAGGTGGVLGSIIGGNGTQVLTSGGFTATFADQMNTGTWYAIELGNFSLWFATTTSVDGDVGYAGYATSDTIVGRTSVGSSGLMESLLTGSFFIGHAAGTASADASGSSTLGQ